MANKLIDVTFVADTNILADGDVVTDTVEIPHAVDLPNQAAILDSIVLHDEDDQGIALDIVFLRSSVTVGTKNAAPNISDANAREIIGIVNIATSDYVDLGGNRVANKRLVGLAVKPVTGTSIYASIITRGGTPTYTASGLKAKFGFRL